VWTSSNGGASWSQVASAAPWAARDSLAWAYSNGVHVIYGGSQYGGYELYYGDLWASTDDGASWVKVANSTSVGEFDNTAIVFDPYGFLYLFGGENSSTGENGYTWGPLQARSTVPIGSVQQLQVALGTASPPGSGSSSSAAAAPSVSSSSASSAAAAPSSSVAIAPSGPAATVNYLDFVSYPNPQSSVECTATLLLAPLGAAGSPQGAAGDIVVFGGNHDGSELVQPVSNTAALNTSQASFYVGSYANGPYTGQAQCAARFGTSNMFYSIGVNSTVDPTKVFGYLDYSVYTSTDGVTWTDVIDAASQQLFLSRPDDDLTHCGVDSSGTVYDIGSATTYTSSNAGVTWTAVPLTGSRFANRTSWAGGIFTSQITSLDTLIVIGGRGSPTPANIYGGGDYNDVSSAVYTVQHERVSSCCLPLCCQLTAIWLLSPAAGVDVVQRWRELDAGVVRCSLGGA
jgi:hypothetical protein